MQRENLNKLILEYEGYASRTINLIASENYPSLAVRKTLSSILVGKYAEGYPGNRFYAGNMLVDKIELQVQELAKEAFNTNYFVNVQAHAGSIANQAIINSVLDLNNNKILSLSLADGGHLSHGASVSITGKTHEVISYHVNPKSGKLNMAEIAELAKKHKPKLIICGFTSYPYSVDFATFAKIAKSVDAYLLADISHITVLVISGAHQSPFGLADFVMTTTHKSLSGPRGALIFSKTEDLSKKINKAVFPQLQGGPHVNNIAGIGIALNEVKKSTFKTYCTSIIENAKAITHTLTKNNIVHSDTENHLLLINTQKSFGLNGKEAQDLLEEINILVNKNSLPGDPSAIIPSGIRVGTPAMTKRGMKPKHIEEVTNILVESLRTKNKKLTELKNKVISLAQNFPIS